MQVKTGLFKDQEVFEISLYTRVMRFEGARRQIYLGEGEFSLAPDGRYNTLSPLTGRHERCKIHQEPDSAFQLVRTA
jgi:hypothetical protein